MFVLVRFLSGVPFTELQALKSRGDDYRRYQRETNAFFPWFPRQISPRHQEAAR
jgi:steroid 5-alpha reductase family enzyme